jgi:hypothetical protein
MLALQITLIPSLVVPEVLLFENAKANCQAATDLAEFRLIWSVTNYAAIA